MYKNNSEKNTEKNMILELIHAAPYILGVRNGYLAKNVLEQLLNIVYSNTSLPRSMTMENFQRNIMTLYKRNYKKDTDMDYISVCETMRIPKTIIAKELSGMDRQDCIEAMKVGKSYVVYMKIGGYKFEIAGTLQGLFTNTGKSKYQELSEDEKNNILIAIYNRVFGTVLLPVNILQGFVSIPDEELYEAGMLVLKEYPLLLYKHKEHYGTAATVVPCTEQISIADYAEQLLDDIDIDAGLIIEPEALIEQYKGILPRNILECYIENKQREFRIVQDVLYFNKYDWHCTEDAFSSSDKTDTSILSENESYIFGLAPIHRKSSDERGGKRRKRKLVSYRKEQRYGSCKDVLPRLHELWEEGLDDKSIRNTLYAEGYRISQSTYYRYRNKYRNQKDA